MSVGDNVRRLREQRGVTQIQLADLVHVSGPMISMIERGTRGLTISLGQEIATALGCNFEEIFKSDSSSPI